MSPRGERVVFFAVAGIAFVYVLVRAVLVPLTHDEAATFQTYVLTGRYLPFLAHWDAGNHLLTTAIGRASYLLFGPGPISLRSFSVLCYALYAVYSLRHSATLRMPMTRWCTMLALLLTPFLLDFFSMFRGYGPSLAFLLMALFHAGRFAEDGRRRDLILMLGAIMLGSFASLSLLLLWCLFLVWGAVMTWKERRNDTIAWLALIVLGAVSLYFAASYSMGLSARGLLYFGTAEGLFRGSLGSLGEWVIGVRSSFIGAAIWVAALAAGVVAMLISRQWALRLLVLMITGEFAGRMILGTAFNILYPQDRTIMHVVPLFVLLVALSAEALAVRWPLLKWTPLLLLWLPMRTVHGANTNTTLYWPEQAIPEHVFELVEERQRISERPLLIGGYRQNPRNWIYHASLRGAELNFLDEAGFPQPTCDMLLIDTTFFRAPVGFHAIYASPSGRLSLMEREPPLTAKVLLDSTWTIQENSEEFNGLWSPSVDGITGREWLIEVDAKLRSPVVPLELRLVLEVKAADGNALQYDVIDLEDLRAQWSGERLHVLRRLGRFNVPVTRVVAYFWDPRKQAFAMDTVRLKIHEVIP